MCQHVQVESHFHFAAFAAESPNSFVFGRGSCELIRLEVANHFASPASIFRLHESDGIGGLFPLWLRSAVVLLFSHLRRNANLAGGFAGRPCLWFSLVWFAYCHCHALLGHCVYP